VAGLRESNGSQLLLQQHSCFLLSNKLKIRLEFYFIFKTKGQRVGVTVLTEGILTYSTNQRVVTTNVTGYGGSSFGLYINLLSLDKFYDRSLSLEHVVPLIKVLLPRTLPRAMCYQL